MMVPLSAGAMQATPSLGSLTPLRAPSLYEQPMKASAVDRRYSYGHAAFRRSVR